MNPNTAKIGRISEQNSDFLAVCLNTPIEIRYKEKVVYAKDRLEI